MAAAKDSQSILGRNPDRLSLPERQTLTGKYVALEIYSPATTPLRRIEAVGDSLASCLAMLESRGLDAANFEFSRLAPPY